MINLGRFLENSRTMTLEEYKQQVEDYLTNKLGRSTMVASSLMKEYETVFQAYLEDGYTPDMMATGMDRNLL